MHGSNSARIWNWLAIFGDNRILTSKLIIPSVELSQFCTEFNWFYVSTPCRSDISNIRIPSGDHAKKWSSILQSRPRSMHLEIYLCQDSSSTTYRSFREQQFIPSVLLLCDNPILASSYTHSVEDFWLLVIHIHNYALILLWNRKTFVAEVAVRGKLHKMNQYAHRWPLVNGMKCNLISSRDDSKSWSSVSALR